MLVAAAVLAPAALGSGSNPSYCSPSGDVCIGISHKSGDVWLEISTPNKYFSTYKLCVAGPKNKVCHTYAIKKSGAGYDSKVSWSKSFPNQGHGTYKVTWSYSAKSLSFKA